MDTWLYYHLAANFLGNGGITVKLSYKNVYIVGTFLADICHSGNTFLSPAWTFWGEIYLLVADTLWLVGKKENTYMLLLDTFL